MTTSKETPEQEQARESREWMDAIIEAEEKFGCSAGKIPEEKLIEARKLLEREMKEDSAKLQD